MSQDNTKPAVSPVEAIESDAALARFRRVMDSCIENPRTEIAVVHGAEIADMEAGVKAPKSAPRPNKP